MCAGGTLSAADVSSHAEGRVKDMLDRLVARNDGFGGGVVRVSGPDGFLCEAAAGRQAGPGSSPMTADTPFEIASITKAVTAATVLRLVEDGKLRLDDPLKALLPAGLRQGFSETVTVRQLLSHTSGLPHYWEDGPKNREGNNVFLSAFLAEPGRFWQAEDILAAARTLPAKRAGSRFHYSDTNYVLLGLIIEHTTGRPLHQVFREKIFAPLGMTSTWLSYREKRRGPAPSHRYEGTEDLHDVPRQSADWAGGGLVSTARDLERFLRGLASGKVFRHPETLDLMRKAVPTGEPDISYGLGIYRVKLEAGLGELWGHDGHGNSFAYYWPQRDITFTGTLNQTENDWWPLVEVFLTGDDPAHILTEMDKTFEAVLATGWDSLYMDRGVNGLRDGGGYGAGIAWTSLDVTWGLTDQDFLTVNTWFCTATSHPAYQEFDVDFVYTRTFGDLALSLGYTFNYGYSEGSFTSHELAASLSHDWTLGPAVVTPSLTYYYTLGPDADNGGFVEQGSSFLVLRVDGSVPVHRDVIALEPWAAFGINFRYNTREGTDGEWEPFSGVNNLEFGLAVPVRITRSLTVAGYGAYSRALTNLTSTEPNTFWGGASVIFTF